MHPNNFIEGESNKAMLYLFYLNNGGDKLPVLLFPFVNEL